MLPTKAAPEVMMSAAIIWARRGSSPILMMRVLRPLTIASLKRTSPTRNVAKRVTKKGIAGRNLCRQVSNVFKRDLSRAGYFILLTPLSIFHTQAPFHQNMTYYPWKELVLVYIVNCKSNFRQGESCTGHEIATFPARLKFLLETHERAMRF